MVFRAARRAFRLVTLRSSLVMVLWRAHTKSCGCGAGLYSATTSLNSCNERWQSNRLIAAITSFNNTCTRSHGSECSMARRIIGCSVPVTLLPISSFDLPQKSDGAGEPDDIDPFIGYIFEPNAETVLDAMLPYYLQYQVFQMILDARASEHSARMVAMKNATDNALQFIKDLTLEYNKMRQASITTELLEIATAQMALGG